VRAGRQGEREFEPARRRAGHREGSTLTLQQGAAKLQARAWRRAVTLTGVFRAQRHLYDLARGNVDTNFDACSVLAGTNGLVEQQVKRLSRAG
jgi:hypothetical protein